MPVIMLKRSTKATRPRQLRESLQEKAEFQMGRSCSGTAEPCRIGMRDWPHHKPWRSGRDKHLVGSVMGEHTGTRWHGAGRAGGKPQLWDSRVFGGFWSSACSIRRRWGLTAAGGEEPRAQAVPTQCRIGTHRCQPLQCQPLGAASRAAGAGRGPPSWDFIRQGKEKGVFPYSPKSIRIQMCHWLKYPSSDTNAFQSWPTEINVPGFPGVKPRSRAGFRAVRTSLLPRHSPFSSALRRRI